MVEQITLYHDDNKGSPFCHKIEIALIEAGATYATHGFDVYNKPAWFAQVNPLTGKIPAITYGGPNVPPDAPSPLSFKLTESHAILEFLADIFPNASLLPPATDPAARARVRLFIDVAVRDLEALFMNKTLTAEETLENSIRVFEKIQTLLPDPDAADGGEYAIGKAFTSADCAITPWFGIIELSTRTGLGRNGPGSGKVFGQALEGEKFEKLRRYKKAVLERESVKKAINLDFIEGLWRAKYAQT